MNYDDYDGGGFMVVPADASPDGSAFIEILRYDYEQPETDYVIERYDDNLDLVTSVTIKLDKFINPEYPDEPVYVRPEEIYLEPYDDMSCRLTQYLFNSDDNYEYVLPVFEMRTDEENGWQVQALTGFKIMSEDGTVIQTVNFEGNDYFGYYYFRIYNMNGKQYLCIDNSEGKAYFYSIEQLPSGVSELKKTMTLNITPRMAGKGETFTVEFDTRDNVEREVVVSNAAGQTMFKQKVPAGQTQVRISAARLSKGVNVVSVKGGSNKESCKVIVK